MENQVSFERCKTFLLQCKKEAAKRIVGQTDIIENIVMALVAGGHVLLEGVPGLAKTLIVKTFADMSGLDFKRIQFTPDLLPADLTGTLIYDQSRGTFSVRKGPVFANFVLADEINRASAKVQSALLEAMAETQVTIGEETHLLPKPFFVLATQNPIEQEGTYNLPEAELDRFLLKLNVPYPTAKEEFAIIKNSADSADPTEIPVTKVCTADAILAMRAMMPSVTVDDKIIEYIVSLVAVTRAEQKQADGYATAHAGAAYGAKSVSALHVSRGREDILRYIAFGASPRAGIALQKCAKIAAMFDGRSYVLPEDVKKVAHAVLRHRLVLSYEASADGLTADDIITKILAALPVP